MRPRRQPPAPQQLKSYLSRAKTSRYSGAGVRCQRRLARARRIMLTAKLTDNERNVLSSETKAVAENVLDLFFASHVGHVVQVALRIRVLIIYCWRKHAFTQGHDGNDELNGAGGGDEVSNHALAATHR